MAVARRRLVNTADELSSTSAGIDTADNLELGRESSLTQCGACRRLSSPLVSDWRNNHSRSQWADPGSRSGTIKARGDGPGGPGG